MKTARGFIAAQESINWANDAIREFKVALDHFLADPELGSLAVEMDLDTGQEVFKFKFAKTIPSILRRKATDALLNARHSLDQSLFGAITTLEGPRKRGPYYPFAGSPDELDKFLVDRRISRALWDCIKRHQPYPTGDTYPGGNNLIRTLAQMAGNKHTVGLSFQGVTAGSNAISGPFYLQSAASPLLQNQLVWDAVKNEIELARGWDLQIYLDGSIELTVHIALDDPRLPQPVEAVLALAEITGYAQVVLNEFKAVCADHPT
jgi:hypothetical protein